MAAKLFYTDPLKAAIMEESHGVKFEGDKWKTHTLGKPPLYMPIFTGFKVYISPDSHSIFEPREGDVAVNIHGELAYYDSYDSRGSQFKLEWVAVNQDIGFSDSGVQIILRDNKHFFFPLTESNDD